MVCVLEMIFMDEDLGIDDFCIVIVEIMRIFERLECVQKCVFC